MPSKQKDEYYKSTAKALYHVEGECEVDDNATISRIDDPEGENGAYVSAWVWVPDPEEEEGDCRSYHLVEGVIWPISMEGDETHAWVQKCDECAEETDVLSDDHAALRLLHFLEMSRPGRYSIKYGKRLGVPETLYPYIDGVSFRGAEALVANILKFRRL